MIASYWMITITWRQNFSKDRYGLLSSYLDPNITCNIFLFWICLYCLKMILSVTVCKKSAGHMEKISKIFHLEKYPCDSILFDHIWLWHLHVGELDDVTKMRRWYCERGCMCPVIMRWPLYAWLRLFLINKNVALARFKIFDSFFCVGDSVGQSIV